MSNGEALVQLRALQTENKIWTDKNFPGQSPWEPFGGLIEELGELVEAEEAGSQEAIADAIADFMVYAASYCNHQGWDFAALWEMRVNMQRRKIEVIKGKLAHHHLKAFQRIRGDTEFHRAEGARWLSMLLLQIDRVYSPMFASWTDLPSIAYKVWKEEVQPRDWTKKKSELGAWGQYKCHKVVHAGKITKIDQGPYQVCGVDGAVPSLLLTIDGKLHPTEAPPSWVEKHKPVVGGYLVVYEDGYTSFSPAEAFESGYTRIA